MATTKTSLGGLFAKLLKPVTDVYAVETGKQLDVAALVKSVRVTVAGWLRRVASWLAPEAQAEAKPEPEPVAVVEVVPVVPAGWDYVETSAPADEVSAVQPVAVPDLVSPAVMADAKSVEQPTPKKTARKPRKAASTPKAKKPAAKAKPAKKPATKAKPASYRERVKAERKAKAGAKRKVTTKASK